MFSHVTYVTPLMLHATKSKYPLLLYILVLLKFLYIFALIFLQNTRGVLL